MPAPKRPLQWQVKFIGLLADGATVREAVRAVKKERGYVYRCKREDEKFAAAWAEAVDNANDLLQRELWDRAVHGVERPVFQGGNQVGTVTERSDDLLKFILRGRMPEIYRENVAVEVGGQVSHELTLLDGRQPIEIEAAKRREAAQVLLLPEKVESAAAEPARRDRSFRRRNGASPNGKA